MSERRTSLGFLIALYAALALALAAGGLAYYRHERRTIQAQRYRELRAISALKISQIVAWRNERLNDVQLSASQPALRNLVERWLKRPSDSALREDITRNLAVIQEFHGYQNIMLLGMDKRLLLTLDPRLTVAGPPAEALLARVVQEGRPALGELFRCTDCSEVQLDVAAPVLDPGGRPLALLLLRADPEQLLYPLIQSWPTPSESAETLLVQRDGEQVIFLNRLRHNPAPAISLRFPLDRADLPAVQAVLGRTGEFFGQDHRDRPVMADLQPVPGSTWFMIAKVDTDEIFAEARYRGSVILGFTVLGILMIGTLFGFLFYFSQAQLYQDLFRATRFEGLERTEVEEARIRRARLLARLAGFLTLTIGGLALAGWILELPALKSVLPGFVAMKANTALGLLLAGTSLAVMSSPLVNRERRGWAGLGAGVVALLGGLTLVQYLFGVDLRIDQLLFQEPADALGTLSPGRMAPATAVGFLLFGVASLLAGFPGSVPGGQWLCLPVGLIGLLPLLGNFYGPYGQFGIGHHFQLALHTAAALILLCLGLLLRTATEGFMRRFMAESLGGWLLRRMAFYIPVLSILIGWVKVLGERRGWYETTVGIALIVTTFVLLMLAATWWTARSLDRIDSIRRQAEAQARETAEEIRATLYGIGDGVIATDAGGHVLHMNPVAERLTGWAEAEAIGQPLDEVFHIVNEETRRSVENPVNRVLREGKVVGLANHTLLIAKDGIERAIADSGAPILNDLDAIDRVVLVFRDQTAERANQRALLASEAKHRRLHDSMWDAYVLVDMEGWILEHNRLFQEMLGYSSEELRHFTSQDFTPEEWRDQEARIIQEEVIPKGYSGIYEKAYRRKDGTVFPVELRTNLLTDDQGRPLGMWAIVRDITERQRAEKALQKASSELNLIFKNLINAFVVWDSVFDTTGRFVSFRFGMFNDAYARISGLKLEEVRGKDVFEVWPETEASWVEAYGEVATSGLPKTFDMYHGPTRGWYHCNAYRPSDSPAQVCVVFEDITERKLAAERLQEMQERLSFALEGSNDGWWDVRLDTGATFLSARTCEILGLPPTDGEHLVHVWSELIHPEDLGATQTALDDYLHGHSPLFAVEQRLRMAGGDWKWILARGKAVAWDASGAPLRMVGTHSDITERKQTEERLRRKKDLLNLTGRIAQVGGWEFDAVTLQGNWTDEMARIHDLEPTHEISVEQAIGFYTEESRPRITQAVREAIEQGKPYDLELELISAQNVRKAIRTVGNPVLDGSGRTVQVRGIIQDITEKKAAENQIRTAHQEQLRLLEAAERTRRALLSLVEDQRTSEEEIRRLNADLEKRVRARTKELEAANRELEAFAYSVSHDLRAPLRHMDGFLTMLGRHLGDRMDDKGAHYLGVARGAAARMGQLVDGLLSFSRLGRTDLRWLPVDTGQLVAAVQEEFKEECADRKVRWIVGPLPIIHGDPTLLRLVFQNLLGNALKFTRNRPEAVIEIQPLLELVGEVGFSVRDNGVGFDPTYVHKLFGVFQRLHREDEFEGTGIGLANVHRIVSRHDGRVWAEGRQGEGATFFIVFPERGGQS